MTARPCINFIGGFMILIVMILSLNYYPVKSTAYSKANVEIILLFDYGYLLVFHLRISVRFSLRRHVFAFRCRSNG